MPRVKRGSGPVLPTDKISQRGYPLHNFRVPYSGTDRARRRLPVKGGRWQVRKYRMADGSGFFWRAGNKRSTWTRKFATHEDAMLWAQAVAHAFYQDDYLRLDKLRKIKSFNLDREHLSE